MQLAFIEYSNGLGTVTFCVWRMGAQMQAEMQIVSITGGMQQFFI